MACGISVPPPGIRLTPSSLEAWSLNHWTTWKVPRISSELIKWNHAVCTSSIWLSFTGGNYLEIHACCCRQWWFLSLCSKHYISLHRHPKTRLHIYLLMDIWTGFQYLSIRNEATRGVFAQVFVWTWASIYLEGRGWPVGETARWKGRWMLIFLRNSLFAIMIVPFHVRTNSSLPGGGRSLGSLLGSLQWHPRRGFLLTAGWDGVLAAHVVSTDPGKGDCALLPAGGHDSPDSLPGRHPRETGGPQHGLHSGEGLWLCMSVWVGGQFFPGVFVGQRVVTVWKVSVSLGCLFPGPLAGRAFTGAFWWQPLVFLSRCFLRL